MIRARKDRRVQEAETDWLEDHCWRCGSAEIVADPDGRTLCGMCRQELFDPLASSADPMWVSESAYWESHALERCWRCMTVSVEPDDEVGLCRSCAKGLRGSPPVAP